MEEVTARVYLVSISRSRYSAVYVGGHAKTALLHAAISAAAHQMCEMLMNVQFRSCRDERSELLGRSTRSWVRRPGCHAFSRIKKCETLVLESFGSVLGVPYTQLCVHVAVYACVVRVGLLGVTVSLENFSRKYLFFIVHSNYAA